MRSKAGIRFSRFFSRSILTGAVGLAVLMSAGFGKAMDWKAQPDPNITETMDLRGRTGSGVEYIKDFTSETDGGDWGVLRTYEVILPRFENAVFFAHATLRRAWPNMRNQAYPYIVEYGNKNQMANLRDGGVVFYLQLENGDYLAVAAMPSDETQSWFHTHQDGRFLMSVGTFGTKGVEKFDTPLFAWAVSDDVYDAAYTVINELLSSDSMKRGAKLREMKDYPEPFEYLGWCSWEHFKGGINEENILGAIDDIEASGVPVRYIIVDMGHTAERGGAMTSFAPDAEKFPNEWGPILERRNPDRIRWMALWHYFEGCHRGFHVDNDFGEEVNRHLKPLEEGGHSMTIRNCQEAANEFYRAFMGSVKDYGFDLLKTDFQSLQLPRLAGKVDNAIQMCANNSRAFDLSLAELGLGLINCNWHNPVNLYNARHSNVGRVSMDYVKHSLFSSRRHLYQSYANTPWIGHVVWPDHDMFHSNDTVAGLEMAVSKAVSGGPVYLSDNPSEFEAELIMPLCYEDGRLLRPTAPAAPLPESLFVEPYRNPTQYRVIAPLAGRHAAVVLYNLRHQQEDVTLTASLQPSDYVYAGAMKQPYAGLWDMPEEGLFVYDWYSGTGHKFVEEIEFELTGLQDRLLIMSPIKDGWAVVGRTDKYLSPAAVEVISSDSDSLELRMVESGPLAVYSPNGAPKSGDLEFEDIGEGLYRVDLPVGELDLVLNITR